MARQSIFESKVTPAISLDDLSAQKAAFFASGKQIEQLQPGESAESYLNRRQMNQEAWRLSQVKEKAQ